MLARKANQDCHYLGETGCTIYARRPQACQRFDCPEYAKLKGARLDIVQRAGEIDRATVS